MNNLHLQTLATDYPYAFVYTYLHYKNKNRLLYC